MSVTIGIDPGNDGGIAMMNTDGEVLKTWRMPVLKGKRETLDLHSFRDVLDWPLIPIALVCVEQIQPMGKANGAVGMAAIMKACGAIWGLCSALRLPYEEVPPQAWQKLLVGVPHPVAKRGESDAIKAAARKAWKAEILNAARRRWPHADLVGSDHKSAKESSGIADALWIAEYARMRVIGRTTIQPLEAMPC